MDENATLRFAAAGAALPGVPVAERLHLLVEAGFFHEHVEFGTRKSLAERFGAIRDTPSCQRGERGVAVSIREHIDLVQSVRRGVIIRQIVRLFLIGHQRWYAFQQKIEIVGPE